MSEEKLLQEIKEIHVFLTEKEPTPDDEIEAREKLIAKFNDLEKVNTISDLTPLITEVIDKLNNWDTLDLWFMETELPDLIRNVVKSSDDSNKDKQEIKEECSSEDGVEKGEQKPSIDINEIVSVVSEQFKDEIGGLKDQIAQLQSELKKKEEMLGKPNGEKPKKKSPKQAPKQRPKLQPPEIHIPLIKKPEPKPKKPAKPISKPDEKTTPKLEAPKIEEPKLQAPKFVAPKLQAPKFQPSKAEIPKIEAVSTQKPAIEPVSAEKPKIELVSAQKPAIEPVNAEKPKIEPVSAQKPAIEPVSAEKPMIEPVSAQKPAIEPVNAQKPSIELVPSKPIKVQAMNKQESKATKTDLFNVFSSVGKADSEKKTRGERKKSRVENPPGVQTTSTGITAFGPGNVQDTLTKSQDDFSSSEALPNDKDGLYQELIALEGRRYSLEKSHKEVENSYQKGSIDDFQFKSKSDELKYKLNEITERINTIRRIISTL